jgi:hypothetical protein
MAIRNIYYVKNISFINTYIYIYISLASSFNNSLSEDKDVVNIGSTFHYDLGNGVCVPLTVVSISENKLTAICENAEHIPAEIKTKEIVQAISKLGEVSAPQSISGSCLQDFLEAEKGIIDVTKRNIMLGAGKTTRTEQRPLLLTEQNIQNIKEFDDLLKEQLESVNSLSGISHLPLSKVHKLIITHHKESVNLTTNTLIHLINKSLGFLIPKKQCNHLLTGKFALLRLRDFLKTKGEFSISIDESPSILTKSSRITERTSLDWKNVFTFNELEIILGSFGRACLPLFGREFQDSLREFQSYLQELTLTHDFSTIKQITNACFFAMHLSYENFQLCENSTSEVKLLHWHDKEEWFHNFWDHYVSFKKQSKSKLSSSLKQNKRGTPSDFKSWTALHPGICYNFNSSKGCEREKNCRYTHQKEGTKTLGFT